MKKLLALAGIVSAPLVLALPTVLPKLGLLLLAALTFPGGAIFTGNLVVVVLPILLIGLLGFAGQTISDSLLFIL